MSDVAMPVTIEWFGCATFRVRAGDLTLFFDTYRDKALKAIPGQGYVRLEYGAPVAIFGGRG